ncbi:M81 family metallopeptidase [Phytohabitans rumicis]|uniref:Microcystin degradation protein MlrC n=1 Tax=Phytohabitans rumicis TaxID=1076125 RepID=A0A6V8LC60_9ACTN|nr:M81 family metallopeptidase [Phytohabitans rumicis]GFJ91656.1 microcystin degradation protein MlrC [Phytohabitans rumicis]
MALRIGIGGIHIECSTFTPHVTRDADFAVRRGDELLARYEFTGEGEAQWVPLVHARAVPGGPVAPDTYARLKDELVDRIRAAGPLDGLLFDIHGAMHVPGYEDVEADLAAAVRAAVGPACLISTATDLHGSVTEALVRQVDLITAHRLAPHEDEWITRERAARVLVSCLRHGIRPIKAWVRVPVLLPGEKTSTRDEPARGLWGSLAEVERTPGVLDAAIWVGYAWADEPRSSAAVVVSGTDERAVLGEAAKLAERYWAVRGQFTFVGPTGTAEEAIDAAVGSARKPFVISDSGDNPTAGGAGDVPFLLERLLARPEFKAGGLSAIYASIVDPDAVRACAASGAGTDVDISVGGRLDTRHGRPATVRGRVEALVDDPAGGLVAVVAAGGVRVIVTSRRKPYHLMADFARLGLDPHRADLVVVKIGYLEPELQRLAQGWMIALTPGGVDQDLLRLGHQRLTRPVYPFDAELSTPDLTPRLIS